MEKHHAAQMFRGARMMRVGVQMSKELMWTLFGIARRG